MHAVSNWTTSPGCCGFRGVFSVGRIIHRFFFRYFLFFERTRPTASTRQPCLMYLYLLVMRPFLPLGKKASSYRGAYRVQLFNLSVGMCVCVCATFVVFTDCEGCTRPISTNPGSIEAGEYGLARGTCFVARRLEVVAVAGPLWISWCVLGAAGFHAFKFVDPKQSASTR